MKTPNLLLFFLAPVLAAGTVRAATADIGPSKLRDKSVTLAQTLLQPKAVPPLAATMRDPFNPPGFYTPLAPPVDPTAPTETAVGPPPPPPPPPIPLDRELLEAMAPQITPSGTAVFGGQTLLLFDKRRLKVGDTLPIIYKGKGYELTITAIAEGTFTLRLHAEEVTRSIKPKSQP